MPRRRFGIRGNVAVAYPGLLGVKTEKGQQVNYPHPLDAPAVPESIMQIRYDTGALSTDAPDPSEE